MESEIGKRKWHRIFGWVTITHPSAPDGNLLVDADRKHMRHYIGNRWVTYKGDNGGQITSIFMNKNELFDCEQKDDKQAMLDMMIEIIE